MIKEYVAYDGPIVTRAFAIKNGLPRFFTGKPCKRGHLSERILERVTPDKTPGKMKGRCEWCRLENQRKFVSENQEKWKFWQKRCRNKEAATQRMREYRASLTKEQKKEKHRASYLANREKRIEAVVRHKKRRIRAMPKWASIKKIKSVYFSSSQGMEVDHIVPIKGENVCGLHVHWNLRVISRQENQSKSNKMPPPDLQIDYSAPGWR